jgi:SAM-dependent methyltransferase
MARAQAVEAILKRRKPRVATLLDYGCGDGFTGEHLQDALGASHLTAVDPRMPEVSCGVARRAAGTVERSRDPAVLRGRRFDLILLCDVLEHVEDDVAVLERLRRDHLAPDGLVLVTVPAFQALFSAHDRFLKHHRRYTLSGLRDVVAAAGLAPVADGYLFGSLLPARVVTTAVGASATAEAGVRGIGGWRGGPLLTRIVTTALQMDNAIMLAGRRLGLTLPGLTAWALCRTS